LGEDKGNPFKIADMLRATVKVKDLASTIKAYEVIKKTNWLIVRVKNKLASDLQNIHLNLIYDNSIIAEV